MTAGKRDGRMINDKRHELKHKEKMKHTEKDVVVY